MRLRDRVAIVTGGAQGIGRGICLRLAAEGARIVVVDVRKPQMTTAVVTEIQAQGGAAMAFDADISSAAEVAALVEATLARFGTIDILVNNAGIATGAFVWEMPEEDWDRVLDVNLKGVFLCCRAVLPTMIQKRSGSIVNIASLVARQGSYQHAHYAASKAGVIAFTQSVAKEAGPHNVRINALSPGRTQSSMEPARQSREREKWIADTPLGRIGQPEDIAAAVAFLCSDDASFITGETLNINGGIWLG